MEILYKMSTKVPLCRMRNGLQIRRIINGMWQVSGAHGDIDERRAVNEMFSYFDAGLTTFDMADIYGPAEEIFGRFLRQLQSERGPQARDQIQASSALLEIIIRSRKELLYHKNKQDFKIVRLVAFAYEAKGFQTLTKWVPKPGVMTKKVVDASIKTSMMRMGVDKLDMLQFHWWDYSDKRYLDALIHLTELKDSGKIGELSLTNFNTCHLEEITEMGIPISSNQIQYSVLDNRPSLKMSKFCEENGISLLTYGTIAGGFLSEKYLNHREPKKEELYTVSLQKYKQMIDAWGGWNLFQELLSVLDKIAKSHGPDMSIANVASRYILDQPAVASIIIGCRFGVPGAQHIEYNLRTTNIELKESDFESIQQVCKKGYDLFKTTGDCGDEYR